MILFIEIIVLQNTGRASGTQLFQFTSGTRRTGEINTTQERLLTAFLGGAIDESALSTKQTQLRDEAATVAETLDRWKDIEPNDVRVALNVFEFAQNAAEIWRGSKMPEKRRILKAVSLNRMLSDVSLVVEKRKPFDELAKRPQIQSSRGDTI